MNTRTDDYHRCTLGNLSNIISGAFQRILSPYIRFTDEHGRFDFSRISPRRQSAKGGLATPAISRYGHYTRICGCVKHRGRKAQFIQTLKTWSSGPIEDPALGVDSKLFLQWFEKETPRAIKYPAGFGLHGKPPGLEVLGLFLYEKMIN